ncbi:helix-turn-helix domain-containing protein [Tardiphaga alba]|uniref:Helix-turn-helix domain-containing protein n=1 Tax=Tardiphaga alba TaxID=340268 RepID=A0ABX8ACS7_9BRAD|nr:helix-turn-helix domain-containing protein [Tardiphaga alba]QUS39620.1 helix-turn-helix domain-containing protein [Tardiphaga alba]
MTNDLKPIRSESDHEAAMAEVERLWGAESGTPDGDRLDLLITLIDAYESRAYPMDTPDPIDAIQFRMEQLGLTRKDLEPLIGTRARVAEIMNRKRGLSIDMIRRLHKELGISAEVLIRPTRNEEAA